MIKNTIKIDEEIHAETAKDSDPMQGVTYNHPCFGMIRVCRQSSSYGHKLFGSEIETNNLMAIEISEAQVRQDLGRNWYYDHTSIMEVLMSPVQYAEMISNPNTQGSPCTIHYRADKGYITPKSIDTVTQYVETKIESHLDNVRDRTRTLNSDVAAILGQKGALKKADKEAVLSLVSRLVADINSNLSFYTESALESIDKAKSEARVEIDSYVSHAITSAGIKAINNPEALKLLIQSDNKPES